MVSPESERPAEVPEASGRGNKRQAVLGSPGEEPPARCDRASLLGPPSGVGEVLATGAPPLLALAVVITSSICSAN